MRRFGWLVLAAAGAACSSGSGGGSNGPATVDGVTLMAGFDPGPAPAAGTGFQVVLPIVDDIAPGASDEYCSWTNIILDKDTWVKSSQGVQSKTGHHTVVYYTQSPLPAGTSRICSNADMAAFRFGIGAGGEGITEKAVLPGDLAVKIPKGAQIVINHHYLNASTTNVPQAQSSVNVWYADPTTKIELASSLAFVDTAMSLPVGKSSIDITCTAPQAFKTFMAIPHMHGYGTHITVDHGSGTTTDRLFDVEWDPSYAFHPPEIQHDPTQPYMINKGDTVHVHCDYDNTTSGPLTFGAEMCVSYMQFVDTADLGNLACDTNAGTRVAPTSAWGPF
jgi:hypothetical protein